MGLFHKPNDKDRKTSVKWFENYKVRTSWDSDKEVWFFSVVDIIVLYINAMFFSIFIYPF